jgi:hypothetical protein
VTRWPPRTPPLRVEAPEWVRVFHREDWSEPDEWEQRMGGDLLHEDARRWHAERRWVEARNAWYKAHPEADYRLEERRERLARRRQATG